MRHLVSVNPPAAETSVVTIKGQIVIPARMRRKMGIKQGTKVCLVAQEDGIVIKPLTKEYFEKMAGILNTGGSLSRKLLEERRKDKERENA